MSEDDKDAPPEWVLKRVRMYLENDMVSLSFLHITMKIQYRREFVYKGLQLKITIFFRYSFQ